jgi:integrase
MTTAEQRFPLRDDSPLGTSSVPSNTDLAIAYLDWCAHVRNRTPETLRAYQSTLVAFLDFIGPTDVRCVDHQTMEAFTMRARLRRGRGRTGAPATRKKEVAILRAFYAWLESTQRVTRSPARMLHGPTVHNVNPKPVPEDQWRSVWLSDLPDGMRVALGLGYFCGLRRAEVVALRADQITSTSIVNFTRKGGGEHSLPWAEMVGVLEDKLPELIDQHGTFGISLGRLRQQSGSLLPWASLVPQAFNKRLGALCSRLGVAPFTPHQLRHSCATNLLRAGVPLHLVAKLLNHSNTTITLRYVKAGGDELREWRAGLDR